MGMKDFAIQKNIILTQGDLQRVEAQLNSGKLSDKEKITLEGVAQELRNKLTCFGEQRDEMMGLEIQCKTPKEPVLECREDTTPKNPKPVLKCVQGKTPEEQQANAKREAAQQNQNEIEDKVHPEEPIDKEIQRPQFG